MRLISPIMRTLATLAMIAIAALLVRAAWAEYMLAPWTRDGRVSAEVVGVAPEVSGPILQVAVQDNQFVRRGDILFEIAPERFRLALDDAQANVASKRQQMQLRAATAARRAKLTGVVSAEDVEQSGGAASIATAEYQRAQTALDLAKLDLERATVRSPVDGYVTHLRLRPGDFAAAGQTRVSILDAGSFWITGYFEETKLGRIRPGDQAEIRLMGFDPPVTGRVDSIGHGIADTNDAPDHLGLPTVDPVFTWVRLARRIPVRIHIDHVPDGVVLAAGMTCSVAVGDEAMSRGLRGQMLGWLRAAL